ncbi:hypothetical protein CEXT_722111 [Caerostris extrusa]|uniref:Uncharacterized protein n=1 Tax=Caerostris extrusa TaxID=172846 RepID=A0AAV4Y7Z1_CAEEX|nr:hypothetical protein CEXT_722111 [Caerostris extrusa]
MWWTVCLEFSSVLYFSDGMQEGFHCRPERDVGSYDPSQIFDVLCAWVYFPGGMQEGLHCHPGRDVGPYDPSPIFDGQFRGRHSCLARSQITSGY